MLRAVQDGHGIAVDMRHLAPQGWRASTAKKDAPESFTAPGTSDSGAIRRAVGVVAVAG